MRELEVMVIEVEVQQALERIVFTKEVQRNEQKAKPGRLERAQG